MSTDETNIEKQEKNVIYSEKIDRINRLSPTP